MGFYQFFFISQNSCWSILVPTVLRHKWPPHIPLIAILMQSMNFSVYFSKKKTFYLFITFIPLHIDFKGSSIALRSIWAWFISTHSFIHLNLIIPMRFFSFILIYFVFKILQRCRKTRRNQHHSIVPRLSLHGTRTSCFVAHSSINVASVRCCHSRAPRWWLFMHFQQ